MKNLYTFVRMRGGVTDTNTNALKAALAFPNAKAVTREQFKDNQVSGLKNVLNILYVLLALSVIVSLIGIINTLVLTVSRNAGRGLIVNSQREITLRLLRVHALLPSRWAVTRNKRVGIGRMRHRRVENIADHSARCGRLRPTPAARPILVVVGSAEVARSPLSMSADI
jgi:hypothetical protein